MASMQKLHKFCKNCGSSIGIDFRMLELKKTEDPERDILALNVCLPRLSERKLLTNRLA